MNWRPGIESVRAITGHAIRSLDSAIMPRCCVFCGVELECRERFYCRPCYADMPWNDPQCGRCASPVPLQLSLGIDCVSCQQRPPPFSAGFAPLRYAFPVDAALKAMKFSRRLDYAPAFGALFTAMSSALPGDIDALLPVPLHWRRHASRGFNQAVEICRPLQRQTGLPMLTGFYRIRPTPYQSGLSAGDRVRNLHAAFESRHSPAVRHVLIIDDVITTGETCRQLAAAVLAAGTARVSVLAVARAGPERPLYTGLNA